MVHGNHTTPDAEVLQIANVHPGDPVTSATVREVAARLERSGRFRSVDVRQRYASFSDPNAVLIVIVIEERVGISIGDPTPGPFKRFRASTMWLPILAYEDGYGFTYGARLSFVDLLGRSTRVSIPLTWGGERRASVAVERTFTRGPFSRVEAAGGTWRREFPPTDEGEHREFGSLRVERALTSSLRVGGLGEIANVSLGSLEDRIRRLRADVVLDTRRDPAFPRKAVYLAAGWERLWFDHARDTVRSTVDARGYLGLPGTLVLVARAQASASADPLPPFEQALLGGTASLRGFRYGYRAGDRLAAGSLEVRWPITSPIRLGRFGLAAFVDHAAVYAAGTSLRDAPFDTGAGAGIFATLPAASFRLDVAHGVGAGTRVHVTFGARF
jgi:outer membrane protein assembly factor BamA